MKKWMCVICVLALSLAVCACASTAGQTPTAAPTTEATEPPTESGPDYGALMDEGLMLLDMGDVAGAIEKFNQAGPAG